VQSKLNVPFLGGLSSYSAFLLVLAAYDRCQNSDARNAFATRGKGLPSSPSASNLNSDGDGFNGGNVGGSIGIGGGAGSSLPVTEGEVFMHFLALFASSSQGFNSSCQGIGESVCPSAYLCVREPSAPPLKCLIKIHTPVY
jgi:hypothetical protein